MCLPRLQNHPTLQWRTVPCVVHDGIEPVSNRKDCTVSKLSPNRLLNELISFQVYRGRGFIENKDFTFTEQRTRQTYQLPLTNTVKSESK